MLWVQSPYECRNLFLYVICSPTGRARVSVPNTFNALNDSIPEFQQYQWPTSVNLNARPSRTFQAPETSSPFGWLTSQAYGVDSGSVQEIFRMQQITHVPHAPEIAQGVINLQGKKCPVVDVRMRFGVKVSEQTDESRTPSWRMSARWRSSPCRTRS